MKTREIEISINKNDVENLLRNPLGYAGTWCTGKYPDDPRSIKAKLIIPVEPEVVEIDWDWISGEISLMSSFEKLRGKRWKAVFTEVVE